MTRVLIAVEDTDASVATANTARRLFGDDAQYIVVNVAQSGPLLWGDDSLAWGMAYPVAFSAVGTTALPIASTGTSAGTASTGQMRPNAVDVAEQTASTVASEAGLVGAEPVGEQGNTADAIVTAAKDHDADVIVIGSHDRKWFQQLFKGSVSKAVTRAAEVPVLVVN